LLFHVADILICSDIFFMLFHDARLMPSRA